MIVILRQVVVGWEVLLIEVQAVALSLEAKLLELDHRCLKGHVLTTGPLGESGGCGLWGGGEGGVAPQGTPGGCGEGEEDSCYRTSWVGTGTALAWVSRGGLGTGQS